MAKTFFQDDYGESEGPWEDEHGEEADDYDDLVEFDPDREYDEEEAIYLQALSQTYKEVRKDLSTAKVGRGFFKPGGSGGGKAAGGKGKGKSAGCKGSNPAHRGSREELMKRTRCFNCGALGHISRDCKQPRKPQGSGGSGGGKPSGGAPTFFQFRGSDLVVLAEGFTGLAITPGQCLVDTGAQDGVCGSRAFEELTAVLREHGLQPVVVSLQPGNKRSGIGGGATVLKVMDAPIGLGGACGIMRVTVLKDMDGGAGIPLLLGVGLLEALAATIDVGKGTLAMPAIGRNTDLVKLPSGHLAASIVNYPDEGWEMPEECLRRPASTRSSSLKERVGLRSESPSV